MEYNITNRVYGCLIGGALGDALGAPVEGMTYEDIRTKYGKIKKFHPYQWILSDKEAGEVTGETALRQCLAIAIIEKDGRVTPNEYAESLMNHVDESRLWVPEEIVLRKLHAGLDPWQTGFGNVPGATATSAMTAIGIINVGDVNQAYQDGHTIGLTHQHGIECAAAGTVAAGTARALLPDSTVDDVVNTMTEHCSDVLYRGIDLSLKLAEDASSVDEFVAEFYQNQLDWRWPSVEWDLKDYHRGEVFSGGSIEILPVVISLLKLVGDDPNKCLYESASFGRDADTIASITGSLVGAIHGADAIDDKLIAECESANQEMFKELKTDSKPGFYQTASRLVDAIDSERAEALRRTEMLEYLLAPHSSDDP